MPFHTHHHHRGGLLWKLLLALAALAALGVLALVIVAGMSWWLWRSEPAHWTAHQAAIARVSHAERLHMAEDVERRFVHHFTAPRQAGAAGVLPPASSRRSPRAAALADDPTAGASADVRMLFMTYEEINAWLTERLRDWLAHQGEPLPEGISGIMLGHEGGHLLLAFRVDTPQLSQIISVTFNLDLLADHKAKLKLHSVHGGRLPLPVEQLASQVETHFGQAPEAASLMRMIANPQDHTFDVKFRLDSRQAALIAYEVHTEGVTLFVELSPHGE